MRDIDRRIRRYRLARYALPDDPVRRHLRWAWLVGALWLLWIGLFSDHSVLRLAGLGRDQDRTERVLERTRAEVARLEAELRDPARMRERGEKALREGAGMARPGEIVYRIDGGRADSLARR
jgi:cell division protein FtsB